MESSSVRVNHPNVRYTDEYIEAVYNYQTVEVSNNVATIREDKCVFKTVSQVPKTGLMLVGWGGNNGTTVTAGILANKMGLKWNTKEGEKCPNYFGSVTQASTVKLGNNMDGTPYYIPFNHLLPMVHPNDFVLGGWDISGMNLAEAMKRAEVLDWDLQQKLYPHMKNLVPLPSVFNPDYVAGNQGERADNIIKTENKWEQVEILRQNIRDFKRSNNLDKVIVLWTATTERYSELLAGINDSADSLLAAIKSNHAEVSPSTLFAVASVLEKCSFINGSPQNTNVPGVIELAEKNDTFVAGDDFKSGQTKMKSVLVDFLVSAGIKPASIVSYNHLGNNDGKNLSAPEQFRSKEISKSNVVDDMVESNRILYKEGEHPDHCVVIKYVPYVKDSKRAMDEYTSEIFMHGKNTIVMHNTCEDSLLAAPLILDLAILCELCERIRFKRLEDGDECFEKMHCVLSILSYLMKAPLVPANTPVVNALAAQRQCLVNVFRACVGLPAENYMGLEHRIPSLMKRFRENDNAKSSKCAKHE